MPGPAMSPVSCPCVCGPLGRGRGEGLAKGSVQRPACKCPRMGVLLGAHRPVLVCACLHRADTGVGACAAGAPDAGSPLAACAGSPPRGLAAVGVARPSCGSSASAAGSQVSSPEVPGLSPWRRRRQLDELCVCVHLSACVHVRLCACMQVCACRCMHACMCVCFCRCVHVSMHVWVQERACLCMCISAGMCLHACVLACMSARMCVPVWKCVRLCMYACVSASAHACVQCPCRCLPQPLRRTPPALARRLP